MDPRLDLAKDLEAAQIDVNPAGTEELSFGAQVLFALYCGSSALGAVLGTGTAIALIIADAANVDATEVDYRARALALSMPLAGTVLGAATAGITHGLYRASTAICSFFSDKENSTQENIDGYQPVRQSL